MQKLHSILLVLIVILEAKCATPASAGEKARPKPDFVLTKDQNHTKFSRTIPPVVRVPSGSVIEADIHEATGGQLHIHSNVDDFRKIDLDRIHTLTGPIYVEGAEVGDVLAVELLSLEPGDWGWTLIGSNGFLWEDYKERALKTYKIDKENNMVHFSDKISIPLAPFLGVMGVAPDTDEMLVTFPPRANGGNMDDPSMIEGTTVYFPVLVDGALFSIGDPHAVQGYGEVCGTAVEIPMRSLFRLTVLKDRSIKEPQYETATYFATTGFAPTIDEAALKATRYMVQHLVETKGMTFVEAYMLCSLAGDLKIAEVVDKPNMLVTMHMPKGIFNESK